MRIWFCTLLLLFSIFSPVSLSDSTMYQLKEHQGLNNKFPWLSYTYYKLIKKQSIYKKISIELGIAIIETETQGRNVIGSQNKNGTYDYGLAQINEVHCKNPKILLIPEINIKFLFYYLHLCTIKSNNDLLHTIRLYNQGVNASAHTYKNWEYVAKVLYHYIRAKNMEL